MVRLCHSSMKLGRSQHLDAVLDLLNKNQPAGISIRGVEAEQSGQPKGQWRTLYEAELVTVRLTGGWVMNPSMPDGLKIFRSQDHADYERWICPMRVRDNDDVWYATRGLIRDGTGLMDTDAFFQTDVYGALHVLQTLTDNAAGVLK